LTPTRIMTGIEVGGSSLPKARRHTVRVRGIDTEFCKSGPGVPEWYCCLYASFLYIVLVTSFSTHLEYLKFRQGSPPYGPRALLYKGSVHVLERIFESCNDVFFTKRV
jgi:hypothetical protein